MSDFDNPKIHEYIRSKLDVPMTNPANELIARWRENSKTDYSPLASVAEINARRQCFIFCADELTAIAPEIERLARAVALVQAESLMWDAVKNEAARMNQETYSVSLIGALKDAIHALLDQPAAKALEAHDAELRRKWILELAQREPEVERRARLDEHLNCCPVCLTGCDPCPRAEKLKAPTQPVPATTPTRTWNASTDDGQAVATSTGESVPATEESKPK